MVSIFTMVHGREDIHDATVSIFPIVHSKRGYNDIMVPIIFSGTCKRGYNDATVSIFSMVHGREVIMMQRCLYFQWYMEERL